LLPLHVAQRDAGRFERVGVATLGQDRKRGEHDAPQLAQLGRVGILKPGGACWITRLRAACCGARRPRMLTQIKRRRRVRDIFDPRTDGGSGLLPAKGEHPCPTRAA
jgi:hypothetical protein